MAETMKNALLQRFSASTSYSLFLGMSEVSVPVECLFLIASLICNSRRSSICPSKLNKISCIGSEQSLFILGFLTSSQFHVLLMLKKLFWTLPLISLIRSTPLPDTSSIIFINFIPLAGLYHCVLLPLWSMP